VFTLRAKLSAYPRHEFRAKYMNMHDNSYRSGYASPMILMHWLIFILVAVGYALMELKSFAPRGSDLRSNMAALHYLLGLLVLVLVFARLMLRMSGTIPPIEPAVSAFQAAFAKFMHWFLYAFLIAMPVLGWLALSAKGRPVHLFFFDLPFPIDTDDGLAKQLKRWHEYIANAGYFAIGLHAAFALFHHYIKRDTTLKRMLPGRWR
jgi:cytochrome b561